MPALLTPGEFVIPEPAARSLQGGGSVTVGDGGNTVMPSPSSGVTVNIKANMFSREEGRRMVAAGLIEDVEEMKRRGFTDNGVG